MITRKQAATASKRRPWSFNAWASWRYVSARLASMERMTVRRPAGDAASTGGRLNERRTREREQRDRSRVADPHPVGPHLPHRLKGPRPPDGLQRLIERVAVHSQHEGHGPAVGRQKRLALIGQRFLRLPRPRAEVSDRERLHGPMVPRRVTFVTPRSVASDRDVSQLFMDGPAAAFAFVRRRQADAVAVPDELL